MLISIIIPCYNGELYISDCLSSIESQDYANFEVIVVDDCSTDNSVEFAKEQLRNRSLPGRILQKDANAGESNAVNSGLQVASGEVALVLSVDDKLARHALSNVANALQSHPDSIGCYGNWTIFDEQKSHLIDLSKKADVRWMVKDFDCLPSVGSAFRLEYKGIRLMRNPAWGPVADFEFWLRCATLGPLEYVPENLGYWRDNANSQSNTSQCKIAERKTSLANQYCDEVIGGHKGGKYMLVAANLQAYSLGLQASCEGSSSYLAKAIRTSPFVSFRYLTRTLLVVHLLKSWLSIVGK
jgi:glycosyltransferase involved in cell wall biosynthesis